MEKLKVFKVKVNGKTVIVNVENESQAKWAAVAVSLNQGSCTDADFKASKFEEIVEVKK